MASEIFAAVFVVQANPVSRYLHHLFHKDPFQGLYQPNAFDLSILIPYFTILIILSVFGIHRYHLTHLFRKNRHKLVKPGKYFDQLPRVTVQLPIYNERYVVERLLEAVTRLDYPRELLEIQ